jgi:hypothetical protein
MRPMSDGEQCCKRSFAASLWDSAKRAIKDPVPIPAEAQRARLEICEPCDKYVNGRCAECGCVLALKVRFAHMECPIGRWGEHAG